MKVIQCKCDICKKDKNPKDKKYTIRFGEGSWLEEDGDIGKMIRAIDCCPDCYKDLLSILQLDDDTFAAKVNRMYGTPKVSDNKIATVKHKKTRFTDEELKEIEHMWRTGHDASYIGRQLGRSRQSIVYYTNRYKADGIWCGIDLPRNEQSQTEIVKTVVDKNGFIVTSEVI